MAIMRYVALLRGINVGRARQVDMPRLREVLTAAGHGAVRTHLRSGNVVLDSPLTEPDLVADLQETIRAAFDMDVPVVVRSGAELAGVVAADPLGSVATDPARYLVTFLPEEPDARHLAALPEQPEGDDAYRIVGRELYQWLPAGVLRSPLSSWKWDRLLGRAGTARNWNTVTALAELAA